MVSESASDSLLVSSDAKEEIDGHKEIAPVEAETRGVDAETPEPIAADELVLAVNSFDADKSFAKSEDSESTKDLGSKSEDVNAGGRLPSGTGGLHVSRMDGVGTTCVVVAKPLQAESASGEEKPKEDASVDDSDSAKEDHSAWETVEVRSRGNRKKSDRPSNHRFHAHHGHGNHSHGASSKKSKQARTAASRRRTANRKMVREILSSVLDAVDEEVRRRRQQSRDNVARQPGNKWAATVARSKAVAPATSERQGIAQAEQTSSSQKKGTTMRDVLMGKQGIGSVQAVQKVQPERARARQEGRGEVKQGMNNRQGNETRKGKDKVDRSLVGVGTRNNGHTVPADQNTAPTVPETLSAVSANSVNTDAFRAADLQKETPVQVQGAILSDTSSGESAEALKPQRSSSTMQADKEISPSPPLPTLLGPGNANSASSSVASSLDAPHAGHHPHHHSFSAANENDVGYHLLDVCDRLTRDMVVFMNRRAHALSVRRRERGAVLVALQESLSVRFLHQFFNQSLLNH